MPQIKCKSESLALDSERIYSKDGHLHIGQSHISKACVSPYMGSEIPGAAELGLDPEKIYYLLRSPDELRKAAWTFVGKPILSKHQPVSSDNHPVELIVGAIGSEVEFNDPFLDADLTFWTNEAIAGIETDTVRELSCGYHYVPVMNSGIYNGESYDGIMTEIVANHLAQVESGRAGPEVMAADSKLEIKQMKMTKFGKVLFVALGAVSPKLALDAAFPALVANAERKTFDKAETRKKLIALDADIPAEKMDAVMDAMMEPDDDPEPKAKAKAKDEDLDDEAKKKKAEDEDLEEEKKKKAEAEKMKGAMDSLRKDLREAADAKLAVRSVVGDVIACDSASEIYVLALDAQKVPHEGVTELAGLKSLFALSQTNKPAENSRIALDAAGDTLKRFPALARFGQA